ncbi:MAG: sugar kinase [Clostridiales Family XIII bacterium]|jgi:sugar (pentulose or hexulose) kinase|nr:sugar kinase [Clostridiales Family XIII bacterium]
MQYFVGIDGGSQSTKVLIIDEHGNVVASDVEPLKKTIARKLGWVEHPDDDLWDTLKIATKRLMDRWDGDKSQIKGVGLCTIRCCRTFMDAEGNLVEPVMSWMDVRSYEKFINEDRIRYTAPTTGYMAHRLTGKFVDTAANAFQWQFPVDIDTWNWSEDEAYFNSFEIPREKLLDLMQPGEILGTVTKEASELTGLPIGLPVVATGNDKAVEGLGAGLIHDDTALISLGTYIASMVCGKGNAKDPVNYWTNLSCIPGRYLYESNGIRRGMWHVSWLKSIIGEEYEKKAASLGLPTEELLALDAKDVPPGSDGLLTIPDWLAPADQLYRKGVMIGFDERHTRGHIYRSILESIAMTLKNQYDGMIQELGIKPKKIIISGGGSNSDLFMQIFADMYGVTTVRNVMNGAAGLGGAICAAVATGVYADFDEAVAHMVRVKDEFTPNPEATKAYDQINTEVYSKLPALLEPTLKTMYRVLG